MGELGTVLRHQSDGLGKDKKGPLGLPPTDPTMCQPQGGIPRRLEEVAKGQDRWRRREGGEGVAFALLLAERLPHTLVLRGDHLSLQAGCSCGWYQLWGEQGRGALVQLQSR